MSSPWIIPSRPCPFFARGNCFFFEKCSFLHELSPAIDSSSLSNEEPQRESRKSPILQSRFSVDFNSSDEDETRMDFDDGESDILLASMPHTSHSPSRHSSRKDSTSSYKKGNPHIRDSVMTIKGQNLDFPDMHHYKPADESVQSSPHETQLHGARTKHSRGPQLSLSIPNQSIHISHRLVLEDLKRTLGRDFSSTSNIPNAGYRGVVITGSAQSATLRQRSGTIRPLHQAYRQQKLDKKDSSNEDDRSPLFAATVLSLTSESLDNHEFVVSGAAASASTVLQGHRGIVEDVVSSSPTPKTPQTPNWLKPLKLAAMFNPQSNAEKPLKPEQSELPQPQFLSPITLLAHYSEDFVSDDVQTQSILDDSTTATLDIPINSPKTIILSDAEDDRNFVPSSRAASLDIDMALFPPARSEHDDDGISSTGSITLSVLMGSSPRPHSERSLNLATSPGSVNDLNKRTIFPKPDEFQSALEHRAQKIKESISILNLKRHELSFVDSVVSESPKSAERFYSAQDSNLSEEAPLIENSLQIQNISQPYPRKRTSTSLRIDSQRSSLGTLLQSANSRNSPDPSYRPQLLFAIASDKPQMVEDLLASGQSSVNEMSDSGTDLLDFTVSNRNLKHKTQIVKTLLKYGADPAILTRHENQGLLDGELSKRSNDSTATAGRRMNAAMEYFLTRQSLDLDSNPTLQALQQSSFAPLAKARFDIIGQDRVLDEFYRVIGLHSQRKSRNALVILLCGASGHGKSFLAQKVGSLLNVPIHTINMTALRSQHDLWQCLSTGAEDASPNMDLGDFLVENQGRRSVVVLDEIEKVDDPKALNPLLLPWDIGRCSLEQKKHTDTSQVIWIATSNLGQQLITEHFQQWKHPDSPPSRNEYIQLATTIRRSISAILGAPLLSRITAILPFLPFTLKERKAIATEAVLSYQDLISRSLSAEEIDTIVELCVNDANLVEEEGARSLYRVVEAHMSKFEEANSCT